MEDTKKPSQYWVFWIKIGDCKSDFAHSRESDYKRHNPNFAYVCPELSHDIVLTALKLGSTRCSVRDIESGSFKGKLGKRIENELELKKKYECSWDSSSKLRLPRIHRLSGCLYV
jgi:hypothetical protein